MLREVAIIKQCKKLEEKKLSFYNFTNFLSFSIFYESDVGTNDMFWNFYIVNIL